MPASGQSLPMHSAPLPTNVRYASDSDHSRHQSKLTLSANRVLRCDATKRDFFAISDEPPYGTRCRARSPSITSTAEVVLAREPKMSVPQNFILCDV
jgi:hypothetical protein